MSPKLYRLNVNKIRGIAKESPGDALCTDVLAGLNIPVLKVVFADAYKNVQLVRIVYIYVQKTAQNIVVS